MSEIASYNIEAPNETVSRVLMRLRELHTASAEAKTDEERISEGMSNQIIGETTQRALQALIDLEIVKLRSEADSGSFDPVLLLREAEVRQRLTAEIFREHWFESTLSKPDHPIHAATYGTSMFRYDLRMLMRENPSVEQINQFAWIMLDANGLRSFKDCTSHETTTHYLQRVVRILVNKDSAAQKLLRENDITVIPMATGGDEFEFYLRGTAPISQHIIDESVRLMQKEISESPELCAMLNFKDEGVLKQYGMPSSAERKEFEKLAPDARRKKLKEIEAMLPDSFLPSFAGGGARLSEGILRAVERDDVGLRGDDETFHSLREKIVQATIELAEIRQKKNKENELKILEKVNPKRYEFRLRNAETRQIQAEKTALQRELDEARAETRRLLALLFADLEQTGEAEQKKKGNDANDDVTDALQLSVHRNVIEDKSNDE